MAQNEQTLPSNRWMRRFFIITAGQLVSLIGSSAIQFALIWWLALTTASPMALSVAVLCAFIPQLVLGPFAGVWIDRAKRKHVIIGADLFIGCMAVVMSLSFMSGEPPFWVVCLVLGVRSIGNVFHTPAIQSAIPMLVPQDRLLRANSWSQFMQSGALMLGPVFGAMMIAALPMWLLLLTDFLGAVIASITVAVVTIPNPPRAEQTPHFFRELKEGVVVYVKNKRLFIMTLCILVGMIFFMPVASYYPLMTSDYFKASEWHAGAVEFLYAAGMLVCALVVSAVKTMKNKFLWIHVAMFGIGITSLASGLLPPTMPWFWIFAAICCLMGAFGNLYNITFTAHLQEALPPEALGRAFSLVGSLMSLALPLGIIIAGPVAERHGVATWFVVAGAVFMAVSILSAILVLPRRVNPIN